MDERTRERRDSLARALAWAELGEGTSAQQIAWRHNMTVAELGLWIEDDEFWSLVQERAQAMRLSGEEHRMKARSAVSEMMPDMVRMFFDEGNTSPAVRKDIYRELAKQAGFGGVEDGEGAQGPRVELVIDLSGDGERREITVASTGRQYPALVGTDG